jgi:sugar lactone lactonase YvrE
VASGFVFPEAPRWHDAAVWLSDIHGHRVYRVTPDGATEAVVELDDRPSGLGFLPDGTLLVVSMLHRRLLALVGGRLRVHADLAGHCNGFLNDMVVDARGNAYVGARNLPAGEGNDVVVVVRPDGQCDVGAERMRSPNGSAVLADGRTLVVAETSEGDLTAFDIDDAGGMHQRRLFAHVPGSHPDGICADAEGAIWVGSPMTQEFLRVAAGGVVTERVPTPGRWAVACVLGGDDRRTLYGLTGHNSVDNILRVGSDPALDITSAASGWLEAVRVAVPGAGIP